MRHSNSQRRRGVNRLDLAATVVAPTRGAVTASALDPLIDLDSEINRLRHARNAVILAHYYQAPEIQDIADFVGDSLDLSRKAAETDAEVIAFCGVKFMAESANNLNSDKTVVLPDKDVGCSLEDSCPPDAFRAFREAHPDHIARWPRCYWASPRRRPEEQK